MDRATGGLLRRAATSPGRLIGIGQNSLDGAYLTALSIGRLSDLAKHGDLDVSLLKPAIRMATQELAQLCATEGLASVGLVTFGGSTALQYEQAVSAMLEGLNQSDNSLVIRWAEYDGGRFERLRAHLERRNDVSVTTIVRPPEPQMTRQYPWYSLSVTWNSDQEELSVTGLGRDATAQVYSRRTSLSEEELIEFSVGEGWNERLTPTQSELSRRGRKLAEVLFGKDAEPILGSLC